MFTQFYTFTNMIKQMEFNRNFFDPQNIVINIPL